MSLTVAFFRAPSDEAAAEAERRPGGPLGWPVEVGTRKVGLFKKEPVVEELGPAFDGFAARGYDPQVTMGTLEEFVTGRPYEDVEADPRWGAGVSEFSDEVAGDVVTLTESLRDAMASADDATLERVVGQWALTEELAPPDGRSPAREDVEAHLAFLKQLRDLAVRAVRVGEQLYWYYDDSSLPPAV